MGKKSYSNLHDMAMLPFYRAVLLVGVGVGDMVANADFRKESMELLVFASPLRLDGNNLPIKMTLHKFLEFNKFREHIRFKFQWINLSKFTVIINKSYIILFVPNRFRRMAPNIGIDEF
jgi:hypothetical protein